MNGDEILETIKLLVKDLKLPKGTYGYDDFNGVSRSSFLQQISVIRKYLLKLKKLYQRG